jgi:hypothetical protein
VYDRYRGEGGEFGRSVRWVNYFAYPRMCLPISPLLDPRVMGGQEITVNSLL